MNTFEKSAIQAECQAAIGSFFIALDLHDFAACAALMAPDGVWHRKGKPLVGRDAVLADLASRGPEVVTAHIVTNCVISPLSADSATARYYALVYRCDNHTGSADAPAPLDRPVSILIYEDSFVRSDGAWLTASRRSRRLFATVTG
jgi:hypothetical protein